MKKLIRLAKLPIGTTVPLTARYEDKISKRSGYLSRGKEYARMTLPYLLPETEGDRGADGNQHGFSGFGAQAVNHLSNRIVHNLFPSHQPFFNLDWTEDEKAKLKTQGYEPDELSGLLTASVRRVHDYEGQTDGRVAMVAVMKHLIVSGNVCLFIPPNGDKIQALPLSQYTVTRDSVDNVTEIFTKKTRALCTFEDKHRALIEKHRKDKNYKDDDELTLITWAVRTSKDSYMVVQVVEDILIEKSQEVSADELPWRPLRWNSCYGEDYGRGLTEDQAGDFKILEFLTEARMKGMVLMADVKYLVKAGATTDIDELATTPTGEFLVGDLDDVGVLQLERYADFTPISNAIQDYERRLGQVFLMQSAVRRDAERVTAEEIRRDAQELNESLGGIYSHLAVTLQKPYAFILMKRTGFPLGKEKVMPRILTGMEALAKASDLDKLRLFSETMGLTQTWPPELLARTNQYRLGLKVAASIGLDLDFIRNDDEQAEADKAQSDAAMQQNLAMEASKAAPNVIEGMAQQAMGGQ